MPRRAFVASPQGIGFRRRLFTMNVLALHRWHWVLISIFLGALIGFVRGQYTIDDEKTNGGFPDRSLEMERGLQIAAASAKDGKHRWGEFYNVRVRRDSRHGETKYVVFGRYIDPSLRKLHPDGKLKNVPIFFLKTDLPFKPMIHVPQPTSPDSSRLSERLQWLAEKLKLRKADPPGTVIDYLKSARSTLGISFVYEWWREPRFLLIAWMAGSFVVVGLIWPTLLNIVAYGRLSRPYEARVHLPPARASSASVGHQPAALSDEDLARLKEMEEKLEADLVASGILEPSAAATAAGNGKAIKQLTETRLELAAAQQAAEAKAFETREGDFYPVERPQSKPKSDE